MKASALKYTVLTWVSTLAILIILLVPFHAFLTVWAAHIFGHYTAFRLWKEYLLGLCWLGLVFLWITDHKIRHHTLSRRLVWLIVAYALLNVIWGVVALKHEAVNAKALGYALIANLRYLAFFIACWAISLRLSRMRTYWQWIVLWPSFVVIVFGLLQVLVLPHDFLAHFGYGPHTIPAYETINHNQNYIRISSTLRGANPLGAYLIVPISFLSVLLLRRKIEPKQIGLLVAAVVCLFFTFSRSAWLGALISLVLILALTLQSRRTRTWASVGTLSLLLAAVAVFAAFHNNARFENFALHTQHNSAIKTTSNGGHSSALKHGLRDVVHEPLGRGPGTAGPASVYNSTHPTRIAENYYLQIGQELGWLGLGLFLAINIVVGYLLWIRRADSLALALFASFIGLSFVNLLSHAWSDDTLSYIWWGLAGIAMAPNLKQLRDQGYEDPS